MTNTTVRPLTRDDQTAWRLLWNAYLSFYEHALPDAVSEGQFERFLGEGYHNAIVAEQDGKLVGFVHYLFHASTWSLSPTCYLEDLYVDETIRGGGIGRKLIEAVFAAADANGGGKVYWHTHDHNTRARQLYDRIGVLGNFVKYDRP
ncbi:MAG: GNAT family N-acetyltransferase [Roseibium sp.]